MSAEPFDWIITSISGAGSLSNGDGHQWVFRKKGDGWEVEGARGQTASVQAGGNGLVRISGFPGNWNANGDYAFSRESDGCALKSMHSRHRLIWKC